MQKLLIANSLIFIFIVCLVLNDGSAEHGRCRCICSNVPGVLNTTMSPMDQVYADYLAPSLCTCEDMLAAQVSAETTDHEGLIADRCDCNQEIRDTAIILTVVFIIFWIVMLFAGYMAFYVCLFPLVNRHRNRSIRNRYDYTDEINEDTNNSLIPENRLMMLNDAIEDC